MKVPCVILSLCLTCTALAQESSAPSSPEQTREDEAVKARVWLKAGLFYPRIKTTARLDSKNFGKGTTVKLEDDLGMERVLSQNSFEFGFLFGQRWRVSGEFFELKRSASSTLQKEIIWGKEIFKVNATVASFFDVELYRIAVGYDFVQKKDSVLGLALGTHLIDAAAGIGTLLSPGLPDAEIETDASTKGLFPIPNVGLYFVHEFNKQWQAGSRIDWFGITVGEWGGDLLSASISLRYLVNSWFSIRLALEYFNINVDYDDEPWQGNINLEYYGPVINLGLRF